MKDTLIGLEIIPSFICYSVAYCYVVYYKRGGVHSYDQNAMIHASHAIGVVILSSLSLYFNDETVFRELIPIAFSRGYFLVDLWDCIKRKDWVFTFHAVISLTLNVGTHLSPIHYKLRSASKGYMTEISSPFYRWWTVTKSFHVYVIFYITFLSCRLIWVPIFLKSAFRLAGYDWLSYASVAFYVLNLGFFTRMTNILLNYDRSKKKHE
jgi:hypothetical protein